VKECKKRECAESLAKILSKDIYLEIFEEIFMYHVSIVYPDNTQKIIICIPRYLMKKKCRSTFFY